MDKILSVASLALLVALPETPCRAAAPPATEVGVGWSYVHGHRPGMQTLRGPEPQVFVRRTVASDWDLFWRGGLALFAQDGGIDLVSVLGGAALVLDAATWTPSLFVGLGYQGRMARGDLSPNGLFAAGVLLDVRVRTGFRMGLGAEFRLPFLDRSRLPWLATCSLRLLWGLPARRR